MENWACALIQAALVVEGAIIARGGERPFGAIIIICASVTLVLSVRAWVLHRRMAQELASASVHCDECLCKQRHAFRNKLQVILGLMQLGDTNRAVDYVKAIDFQGTPDVNSDD